MVWGRRELGGASGPMMHEVKERLDSERGNWR